MFENEYQEEAFFLDMLASMDLGEWVRERSQTAFLFSSANCQTILKAGPSKLSKYSDSYAARRFSVLKR